MAALRITRGVHPLNWYTDSRSESLISEIEGDDAEGSSSFNRKPLLTCL